MYKTKRCEETNKWLQLLSSKQNYGYQFWTAINQHYDGNLVLSSTATDDNFSRDIQTETQPEMTFPRKSENFVRILQSFDINNLNEESVWRFQCDRDDEQILLALNIDPCWY